MNSSTFKKNIHKKNKYIFSNEKNKIIQIHDLQLEIVTNVKQLKQFYDVSKNIYATDVRWIAPFWGEFKSFFSLNNPFWHHAEARLLILYKDTEPVGRIAGIIDHMYCKTYKSDIGFFGFFECKNQYTYAKLLFQSVEKWLALQGMRVMQGPIDGRIDNGCGFLYHGYESTPGLLSSYSPAYYISFAERFNMKKSRDQIVYRIDLNKPLPLTLKQKADQSRSLGIQIRPFNRFRTNKELTWWIHLFLDTFRDHWGFIPVTPEEVRYRYGVKQLRWIVDPKLFLIAEIDNIPVAYIWATPDYNQLFKDMNGNITVINTIRFLLKRKQVDRGVLHFIGIDKNARHRHIGCLLNYLVLLEMKKRGYSAADVGWIDEYNHIAHKTIAYTGATVHKTYRLFEKTIDQN